MDFNNQTAFNENFSSVGFQRVHQPYDHHHWDYFYERGDLPAPAWMHYATGSYILLVSLTGSIGNALLLWAFSCAPSLQSPSNLLIANLALSDLGLSLFTFPLLVISSFNKHWIFGSSGCNYYVLTAGLYGLMSISTMASIAVDRWCSITRWSKWSLNYRQVYCWIAGIWIYSFFLISPPLMGWSRYVIEGLQTSCTFDWLSRDLSSLAFVWYLIILGFVVPLVVISVCYTQIIRHLVRHRRMMSKAGFRPSEKSRPSVADGVDFEPVTRNRVNSGVSTMGRKNSHLKPKFLTVDSDTRAALTCTIIVVLFVLAWGPYALVAVFGMVGEQSRITPILNALPVCFAKSSAVYNPIVYALMNEKFREAICSLLNCKEKKSYLRNGSHGANQDRGRSRSRSRSLSTSGSDNGGGNRRLTGHSATIRIPLALARDLDPLDEELQEFRDRVNTGSSETPITPMSVTSGLSTISETAPLQENAGKNTSAKEERYRKRLHTIDTINDRRRAEANQIEKKLTSTWTSLKDVNNARVPAHIPLLN